MKRKPLGWHGIAVGLAVFIYEVDPIDEMVLVGYNGEEPSWKHFSIDADGRLLFMLNKNIYYLEDFMRV